MVEQPYSSVRAIGSLSNRGQITDLRQSAEDAMREFFDRLTEDRNVLEGRVAILERRLRESDRRDG